MAARLDLALVPAASETGKQAVLQTAAAGVAGARRVKGCRGVRALLAPTMKSEKVSAQESRAGRIARGCRSGCKAPAVASSSVTDRIVQGSSHEYNQMMKRQMANPYEYHHDLGMYYTRIDDKLIVGSQPQSAGDIERLHFDEGVNAVLNLQQDHDIHYWGIDIHPIQEVCSKLGVRHYRRPARDFDPHSLRYELPRMVAVIDRNIAEGRTVYVHCTAGLGRAPGAAIAYLFWFRGMNMSMAYDYLTSKRPCGPKAEAIRGATYDLAKNDPWQPPLEHLPGFAFTDVADWERKLIQERVRNLYNTI